MKSVYGTFGGFGNRLLTSNIVMVKYFVYSICITFNTQAGMTSLQSFSVV